MHIHTYWCIYTHIDAYTHVLVCLHMYWCMYTASFRPHMANPCSAHILQGSAMEATSFLFLKWMRNKWNINQRGSASLFWDFVNLLRYGNYSALVNQVQASSFWSVTSFSCFLFCVLPQNQTKTPALWVCVDWLLEMKLLPWLTCLSGLQTQTGSKSSTPPAYVTTSIFILILIFIFYI